MSRTAMGDDRERFQDQTGLPKADDEPPPQLLAMSSTLPLAEVKAHL